MRLRISFPIIYKPINWNNNLYVNGGLYDNYPLHLFDKEDLTNLITSKYKYNYYTLGLKCNYINISESINLNNIKTYLYLFVSILQNNLNNTKLNELDSVRTVQVNLSNILNINMNISKKTKKYLIELGYTSCDQYLNNLIKLKKIKILEK